MSEKTTKQDAKSKDAITIETAQARATIALYGAEARAWSLGGRELLWSGDPAYWDGVSPILYPVVGWTRDGERVAGKHYDLQLHGFAWRENFALDSIGPGFARLRLADNERTRAIYPFAFSLTVDYRLVGAALEMAIEIENPGDAPAPYACGLHPAFRWPLGEGSKEGAIVRFETLERAEVPVIGPGGVVSAKRRPVPLVGRDLRLSDSLFADDAVCFLDCASRSLRFIDGAGEAIEMSFPDFQHLGLWMRPGAGYLCLEPWTGYSDPEGFEGDLFDKPSMRVLAPGAKARHAARFTFLPKST
jgi:galactose mutarotase-like enzyme